MPAEAYVFRVQGAGPVAASSGLMLIIRVVGAPPSARALFAAYTRSERFPTGLPCGEPSPQGGLGPFG